MSQFLANTFTKKIENVLIIGLIVLIVIIIIAIASKNKFTKALMMYLFAVIIIVSGVLSSTLLYKNITKTSYINGTPIELNKEIENLNFTTSSIVFSLENDKYVYTTKLPQVEDFDGNKNNYLIYLNDYLIISPIIKYRNINFSFYRNFYSTEYEILINGQIYINIDYLSDSTILTISCDEYNLKNFFEKYFSNQGFSLIVKNVIGVTNE